MELRHALVVSLILLPSRVGGVSAQQTPSSPSRHVAPLDSLVQVEAIETRRQIAGVRTSIDSLRNASKPWPETWGAIVVGVLATLSGFGLAWYTAKRGADAAREARLETHLYDALKWFEGTTQKRSIGLSVIEGNWSQTQLHPTWRGVLLNQAAFLLSVSDTNTEHEHQNLHRIRHLLENAKLGSAERGAIADALQKRDSTNKGMPGVSTLAWDTLAGVSRDSSAKVVRPP